jgi:hypothetical protein
MLGCAKVLGGVFVFGRVTATYVAALEAQPEMNPRVAHFQTFLASRSARVNFANRIEMCANWIRHDFLSSGFVAPASCRLS